MNMHRKNPFNAACPQRDRQYYGTKKLDNSGARAGVQGIKANYL